jgi:hypothetical protein
MAEPVTTSSQFLVEIVEHDITEEGRERTALRGPFVHRSDQTVFQYPGIQECPDKLEHAFNRVRADAAASTASHPAFVTTRDPPLLPGKDGASW